MKIIHIFYYFLLSFFVQTMKCIHQVPFPNGLDCFLCITHFVLEQVICITFQYIKHFI